MGRFNLPKVGRAVSWSRTCHLDRDAWCQLWGSPTRCGRLARALRRAGAARAHPTAIQARAAVGALLHQSDHAQLRRVLAGGGRCAFGRLRQCADAEFAVAQSPQQPQTCGFGQHRQHQYSLIHLHIGHRDRDRGRVPLPPTPRTRTRAQSRRARRTQPWTWTRPSPRPRTSA